MQKEKYTSPVLVSTILCLEESVAAGSAFVKPQTSNDVVTQWETDVDQNHSFEWDW